MNKNGHVGTSLAVQWLRITYNAGDAGSIPGQGTKIPHAAEQLSPRATTREKPARFNERSHMPQLRPTRGSQKKKKKRMAMSIIAKTG